MSKVIIIATLAALACIQTAYADNYAVLVAGSSGYYNYRHQSDVCHAFHVLTNSSLGAIPKENVIVFMYDDIANNEQNPIQGNIINHPDGVNVYPGVNKDYTKDAVTPENFLAVLAGNKSKITGGNGKILNSGPNDNVFIYFADHGAPGLIAFPNSYLYADDLMSTLKYMHTAKKYKNLVFYVEACESGSMFQNLLPKDIGIYATTAATPDQSSYACYYDQKRQTYLGDEYSVRWMEDADKKDFKGSQWTLANQFKLVHEETKQSQPQQYGDLSIQSDTIETFQGYNMGGQGSGGKVPVNPKFTPCGDAADSRDVKLRTLMNRQRDATTAAEKRHLSQLVSAELAERAWADFVMDSIVEATVGAVNKDVIQSTPARPANFECLKKAVDGVERACGQFTDYSLKHIKPLVNMCESGISPAEIAANARRACM